MTERIRKNKYLLISILYCLFSLLCGSLFSFTQSYKVDYLLTEINAPNQHNYYNGFISPYLKIKKNDEESKKNGIRYSNLMNYSYYNPFINSCREVVDNEVSVCFDEKTTVKIVTQNVFQIANDKNAANLYTVDMNMFYSYISQNDIKDILPNNYTVRNGCDSFAYISDTLADKIVSYYNLECYDNPYLEIIKSDTYSTLELNVDGSESTIKLCINSILSSKHRFATQIHDIYGDFALVFLNGGVQKYLNSLSFDIDLKVNQYGNRRIINDVKSLGYNPNNSTFHFYSYDYSAHGYYFNEKISNSFANVQKNSFLPEFVAFIIVTIGIVALILLSLIKRKIKTFERLSFFSLLIVFSAYGFLANFIYIYPYWSLFPIIGLVIILALNWREVFNFEKNIFVYSRYYKISI